MKTLISDFVVLLKFVKILDGDVCRSTVGGLYASMENLGDISEPQVTPNELNDQ